MTPPNNSSNTAIDVFDRSSDLILRPAPNGGYMVLEGEASDPKLLGAYSSAGEALAALSNALSGNDEAS